MTLGQKIGRIFCVSLTLVLISVLAAMTVACILFVLEHGVRISNTIPEFLSGLGIILAGLIVNVICVGLLFQIRMIDSKINLHHKSAGRAGS
jgi:hypothetical protein